VRSLFLVLRREFVAYWTSPIAYVVIAMYMVLSGLFFFGELSRFVSLVQRAGGEGVDVNQQLIRSYLYSVSVMVLFLIPLVTMRLLAEERRQGTLEILLTTPARESVIVLGKYLAAVSLLLVMLGTSAAHVAILFVFGSPDPAPVFTGFLGLFLSGAVYVAMGLFLSGLTQNQVVAGVLSFSLFLLLWLCHWVSTLTEGLLAEILRYLSLAGHFDNFGRGVIDTSDLVFFLSWIAAGLYAATQAVLATRWKP
jgi:ABC-2 type transport system permease protein